MITSVQPSTDEVLAVLPTKLEPRHHRSGLVRREALIRRILESDSPVVALVAPAGYGKSTLAAQLDGADAIRVAWFSADGRDGDSATLVRGLAAAIDRVVPLERADLTAIAGPRPSLWTTAVPRLASVMRRVPELILVIDDVDRIDSPEANDVILELVDLVRGRHRFVLTGRSFGRLPVPRLIARGTVTLFDRADLTLDDRAAADIIAAAGLRLSATQVADITSSTEGWAAGVYLSAMTAARRTGRDTPGDTDADRVVDAYLRTEVLDRLTPEDAELLLGASVLDRISGPLCDDLFDRTDSGAVLDRFERSNLFLIPLDTDRSWYRFHHLLGDALRAELGRRDPARAADLCRRAARWYRDHGLLEQALEYALVAGDEALAAELASVVIQPTYHAGRTETVRRWLRAFDSDVTALRHPYLAAQAVMLYANVGETETAARWCRVLDTHLAASDRADDDDPALAGVCAIGRVMLMRDGLSTAQRDAELAVRTIPDGHQYRVASIAALGVVRSLLGDRAGSAAMLDEAVARWTTTGKGSVAACQSLICLAADALATGDVPAAEMSTAKARRIITHNGMEEQALAVAVDALDARIALAHGAVSRARPILAHAERLRPELTAAFPWLALRSRFDLIRGLLALDDGGGARTLLAEVDEILRVRPDMGALVSERDELADRVAAVKGGRPGASTLTMAELRILPLLTTHLTFREIGERLFISQNTVKTQAISIYRKLDATSRGEAIDRAIEFGLLDPASTSERFIRDG